MRYGILGPLEVHVDGSPVDVPRPRQRAALAFLLLNANRPVPLERMVDAMWGEAPPRTARAQVHSVVSGLRQALPPQAARRLTSEPAGYRLSVTEGAIDSVDFERALGAARSLVVQGEREAATRLLREGLAHWRGKALEGIEAPFAPAAEAHLHEQRFAAYELLADLELDLGGQQRLVPELTALLTEYPARESVAERLASALYLSGRQTDALEVVSRTRALLRAEYGLDVGRTLVELEGSILRQQVIVTAAPVSQAPEAVKTVASSAGQGEDASVSRPAAQLPAGTPTFVSRRAELDQLCAALKLARPESGPVVVTVTGMGGVGKTALAVRAGHLLRQQFPDGQLYVDLRGADAIPASPADVLAGLLRSLGVPDDRVPLGQEARTAAFRSLVADRRILLVLDNAHVTAQVHPLLPGSPSCSVLVTSRNRLPGLAASARIALDRMDAAAAHELFSLLVGAGRVLAEPDATAAVLAQCGGLPLALRIAGARLATRPSWRVATLAAKLADEARRLDELRVEDLAVRASFYLSYAQLSAPAASGHPHPARVFRLLGLVPGVDFGVPAVAALTDTHADHAEAVLEHLVDVCLLDSPAPGRYRLHDLLRVFAAECSSAADNDATRLAALDRITDWYLQGLIAADAALFPGMARIPTPAPRHGQPAPHFERETDALTWCEVERPNLVAAAIAATEQGLHSTASCFSSFSFSFFDMRHYVDEFRVVAEAGVRSARLVGDLTVLAGAVSVRGGFFVQTGNLTRAREDVAEGLRIREAIDDQRGQLRSLTTLGLVAIRQQEFQEAEAHLKRALALCDSHETRENERMVLSNLGLCVISTRRWREGLEFFEQALGTDEEESHAHARSDQLASIGLCRLRLGMVEEAVAPLREALSLAQAAGYTAVEAYATAVLGQTLEQLGHRQEANTHAERARDILNSMEHQYAEELRGLINRA